MLEMELYYRKTVRSVRTAAFCEENPVHEGITTAFAKLLADTAVLENAILTSTMLHGEGGYTAVELLPTGDYRLFSATLLDEPHTGPGVCLKIPPLLEDEVAEDTNQPVFLPAIRTLEDAFAHISLPSQNKQGSCRDYLYHGPWIQKPCI